MSNKSIPQLKSDFMTKLKQIIVAIPNSELLMMGRYKELFETQTFEEFLFKMVTAAREFMGSKSIDNETKFNLFFSYHYYVDLLCESMADKAFSFNQMSLLSKVTHPTIQSCSSPRNETDMNVSLSSENIDTTPESTISSSTLLEKLSMAHEEQLAKVLEIISPQTDEWCVGGDLSTMSEDILEQLSAVLMQ
ncbi:Uncharacterized protein QTN25_006784 [Entamoeba marina]